MANIVEKKADNLQKTLRLLVILLLVVGVVTLAVTVYDLATGSSLLKLFDAKAAEEVTDLPLFCRFSCWTNGKGVSLEHDINLNHI